jgi:methionyl-tRNA formyltransferase
VELKPGPRIVCVGSNLETEVALKGLLAESVPVVGLVTWPAHEPGGGSDYRDLHELGRTAAIEVVDTTNINSLATLQSIRALQPDYVFTLGWSQLFRDELLSIPTGFVVGSHPSPLPDGRGRAPVPWTILQNLRRSAVSLFKMDLGVDSGSILIQRYFDIPPRPYASQVYSLVAENLTNAYLDLFRQLREGTVQEVPQGPGGSVRGKRTPSDGHIDFRWDAERVDRLVRAVSEPYPGAYSYYQGERVSVWRSDLDDVPDYLGVPGQILLRKGGKLLVQAGDRPLWLSHFTSLDGPMGEDEFRLGQSFGFRVEDEIYQLRKAMDEFRTIR